MQSIDIDSPRRPAEPHVEVSPSRRSRVLVVGENDRAAGVVRRLIAGHEVTLVCPSRTLGAMTRQQRFVIQELAFEGELRLWLGVALRRQTPAGCGSVQVEFVGACVESARFDRVVDCSNARTPGELSPPTEPARRSAG